MLVIAMILVGVIAVSTAMAMRLSLYGDQVSQNLRARSLALEAAEAGLRHCETLLRTARDTTPMLPSGGAAAQVAEWTDPANWQRVGQRVPAAWVDPALAEAQRPQCLIQRLTLAQFRGTQPPTPDQVSLESRGISADRMALYRITSRGFSPDYRAGVSGAEIWLQSMVRTIE